MQGLGQIVGKSPVISGAGKGLDVRKHQILAQGHVGLELFSVFGGGQAGLVPEPPEGVPPGGPGIDHPVLCLGQIAGVDEPSVHRHIGGACVGLAPV